MNKVRFTVILDGTSYLASAEIIEGTMPREVFVYRNLGTEVLGEFMTVCDLQQLTAYPLWQGDEIPEFGAPFVRYFKAEQRLYSQEEVTQWTSTIQNDLAALKLGVVQAVPQITDIPF